MKTENPSTVYLRKAPLATAVLDDDGARYTLTATPAPPPLVEASRDTATGAVWADSVHDFWRLHSTHKGTLVLGGEGLALRCPSGQIVTAEQLVHCDATGNAVQYAFTGRDTGRSADR